MTVTWDDVSHLGEVGAALATMTMFWRAARRVEKVVALIPTVEKMAAEFEPNHGGSLRDRVSAVEGVQREHTALLNQINASLVDALSPRKNTRPRA